MLAEMRPHHLGEWMALYEIDPWGEQRADLRSGIVASTLANIHRDPKRRASAYKPEDFMPYVERKEASPIALIDRIKSVFGGLRGGLKKKG